MQSYTSDCFAASHTAQTDLQNMENNFNTLRSNFSGASQPSNPVAGLVWFDTTGGVLKVRNSSNAAWSTMLDIDNEYVLKLNRTITAGAGLTGGGTLTSNLTLAHQAHTGDVTGTTALSIAANAVTMEKMAAGLNIIANFDFDSTKSVTGTSYTTIWQTQFLCPADPTSFRMRSYGRHPSSGTGYIRARIGGVYVYCNNAYSSNTWVTSGQGDISGLTPGTWYDLIVDMRADDPGETIYCDAFVIYQDA